MTPERKKYLRDDVAGYLTSEEVDELFGALDAAESRATRAEEALAKAAADEMAVAHEWRRRADRLAESQRDRLAEALRTFVAMSEAGVDDDTHSWSLAYDVARAALAEVDDTKETT